ncbi:cysteine peptidase family C39 domain-containing protein [Anaerolineales bacterium HSG25]|nr:cysteine peptidase family C39 domain-containing protein [Anaerolineales bacterium HSG25]
MLLPPISHQPQHNDGECLAACAKMVLDYLHHPVSYQQLVKQLQIGQAGAPFRNLRHLERLGVTVLIKQGNISDIHNCLEQNIPPIVFVDTSELSYWSEQTNHAIVVAGITDDTIYLYDRSLKPIQMYTFAV